MKLNLFELPNCPASECSTATTTSSVGVEPVDTILLATNRMPGISGMSYEGKYATLGLYIDGL